jgi:hypothetical protein
MQAHQSASSPPPSSSLLWGERRAPILSRWPCRRVVRRAIPTLGAPGHPRFATSQATLTTFRGYRRQPRHRQVSPAILSNCRYPGHSLDSTRSGAATADATTAATQSQPIRAIGRLTVRARRALQNGVSSIPSRLRWLAEFDGAGLRSATPNARARKFPGSDPGRW